MHSDMKVGLALGVLLIGIVAAFFFRNEPTNNDIPQLANPDQLDERISEKPFTPYLTGMEPDNTVITEQPASETNDSELEPFAQSLENPSNQLKKTLTPPSLPQDWEIPDFLKEPTKEGSQAVVNHNPFTSTATPPDPIGSNSEKSKVQKTDPIPEHNNAWNVVSKKETKPSIEQPIEEQKSEPVAHRMYRIQKGDTLSRIAKEYLGSSARFLDIYNANLDRLKSPNDLRVGMQIKIPSKQNPYRTTSASQKSATEKVSPQKSNTKSSKTGGRFVPVKRHPFRPSGTVDNRSSRLDKEPKPTRRLSQTPPPDLPATDATGPEKPEQTQKYRLDDPINIDE